MSTNTVNEFDGDGFATDSKVAEYLDKHKKTLARWDKSPRLKALGWPDPVYLNGWKHRHRPAVREFVRRAAAAHTSQLIKT